jgi:hypothetical protein
MLLIDIPGIARAYLDHAVSLSKREAKVDAPALEAVHNRNRAQNNRVDDLKNWLQKYHVFHGVITAHRYKVTKAILDFADRGERDRLLSLTFNQLIPKFDALHDACCSAVGLRRDFTSLTSKALWCCYPSAVPVYDNFTQHALWIISRLSDLSPSQGHPPAHRYRPFAEVWLAMYRQVRSMIDEADLRGYPYKVRVFDKVLWIVGEPNYNRDPSTVGRASGGVKQGCGQRSNPAPE